MEWFIWLLFILNVAFAGPRTDEALKAVEADRASMAQDEAVSTEERGRERADIRTQVDDLLAEAHDHRATVDDIRSAYSILQRDCVDNPKLVENWNDEVYALLKETSDYADRVQRLYKRWETIEVDVVVNRSGPTFGPFAEEVVQRGRCFMTPLMAEILDLDMRLRGTTADLESLQIRMGK